MTSMVITGEDIDTGYLDIFSCIDPRDGSIG
jgi:hypothetical protein